MNEIPSRATVAPQVVEILRRMLNDGEWTEMLPSERVLCEKFQVSRPTLRKALAALTREGLVKPVRGLGWRVGSAPQKSKRPRESNSVGILCFVSLDEASGFTLYAIDKMQDALHHAGLNASVHAGSQFASQNFRKAFEHLVKGSPTTKWILIGSAPETLGWFQERKLPVFVTFTTRRDLPVPNLRVDVEDTYRRAIDHLVRLGHRRIVHLLPRPVTPGRKAEEHLETTRSWEVAAAPHRNLPGFSDRIVQHTRTRESIQHVLRELFKDRNHPTAFVVTRPQHALATLTCLTASGVRVPRDVSVISVGYESFLDHVNPSLACFSLERVAYARKLCRLVVPWAKTGYWSPQEKNLTLQFRDGESAGPAL